MADQIPTSNSELRTKAQIWMGRVFKMMIFFAVLGVIVMLIAVNAISNVFKDIVPKAVFLPLWLAFFVPPMSNQRSNR